MSSSDLSPPNRAFRSDCINWLGYKPCDFQALQHLPDCTDCKLFDPTGEIPYLKPAPYDPKILREVGRIGIMEAGGLGSILRTTAVSRAIRILNPAVEIGNFMACVGAMDVLVTSNTFAFHAARAQDVPIVTFEGPLPVSELKVGPRDIVLTADSPFKPCFGHCSHTIMGECVKVISVENVLNQVDHSLRRQEVTLNNSRLA